ncbi:uncharacterized protein LOC129231696 [Uloborus diversus]|uniref:uncharacterized protein LOC129231696 n=1 Tax=Uloborus diversus TaxID=327109 RepID=UPI00240A2F7C|nr:uncharacterized protein LOC129231696 [Uloborus diversus]
MIAPVSMQELNSCSNHSVQINMDSVSWNSSGILRASSDGFYHPNLHCKVTLIPPLSYGLVVSIRSIDLLPAVIDPKKCENYLEISPTESSGSVRLCGYSDDALEFKSYSNMGRMDIVFHTANTSSHRKASFQLTFTAVRKGWCFKEETHCRNDNCIWKNLACDGYNNCGDLSDELDPEVSRCSNLTPGESLAVILVTIVGSLILLIIAAYVRGPKISQQIERLSQCRRTNCTERESPQTENDDLTNSNGPASFMVPEPRTRLNSSSALLRGPDYANYSGINYDPPPRYEDLPKLEVVPISYTVTIQQDPVTIERIT